MLSLYSNTVLLKKGLGLKHLTQNIWKWLVHVVLIEVLPKAFLKRYFYQKEIHISTFLAKIGLNRPRLWIRMTNGCVNKKCKNKVNYLFYQPILIDISLG